MFHTYIWFHLGYTAVLNWGEEIVHFKVFKHIDRIKDGPPLYETDAVSDKPTVYLAKAKVFCEGEIMWFEGCMNWCMGNPQHFMHFCNGEQLADLGMMLNELYKTSVTQVPASRND